MQQVLKLSCFLGSLFLVLFYCSDELGLASLNSYLQRSEDLNTFCYLSVCIVLTELHWVLDLLNLQSSLLDHFLNFSLRLLQFCLLFLRFFFQRNNIMCLVVWNCTKHTDTHLVGPTDQLQKLIVLQTQPVGCLAATQRKVKFNFWSVTLKFSCFQCCSTSSCSSVWEVVFPPAGWDMRTVAFILHKMSYISEYDLK